MRVILEEEAKRGNTDIKIIGNPMTNESMIKTGGLVTMYPEVTGVLMGRSLQQFNINLPAEGPDSSFKNSIIPVTGEFVPVDTPVQDGQKMNIAGLDVQFFTDGINTDSNYQVMAWFPERKISMNNVVWGWYPNIYSVRGGSYRNPEGWVSAVDVLLDLDPEILLTTHATSLAGKDAIRARLQDYRDGLSFVLDQTLKAILLGQRPRELQYAVTLPERLQNSPILIKSYGEVMAMR
jgi:linear primary-alkylsulfatase